MIPRPCATALSSAARRCSASADPAISLAPSTSRTTPRTAQISGFPRRYGGMDPLPVTVDHGTTKLPTARGSGWTDKFHPPATPITVRLEQCFSSMLRISSGLVRRWRDRAGVCCDSDLSPSPVCRHRRLAARLALLAQCFSDVGQWNNAHIMCQAVRMLEGVLWTCGKCFGLYVANDDGRPSRRRLPKLRTLADVRQTVGPSRDHTPPLSAKCRFRIALRPLAGS